MDQSVELRFTPMFVGVLINCILYGVTVVQTFIYFQNCNRDRPWIRYLVLYILVLETVNTICDIGVVYEPLIMRWGSDQAIIFSPIMLVADPIVTALISTPVQMFLAWRVKVISKSKIVPSIIAFFTVASLVGAIATTVSLVYINKFAELQRFDGAALTWLVSSATTDVLITVSLAWNLYHNKTGIPVTDDLLNKLTRLTVQTGLITAAAAISDVSLFIGSTTTLFCIFDFALSKLYTNSLLSTLNARERWRSLSQEPIVLSSHIQGQQTVSISSRVLDRATAQGVYDIALGSTVSSAHKDKSSHEMLCQGTMFSDLEANQCPSSRVSVTTTVERFTEYPVVKL